MNERSLSMQPLHVFCKSYTTAQAPACEHWPQNKRKY